MVALDDTEKGVHVYYIEMRDFEDKKKKLNALEIRDVLDSIGSFGFSMNKQNSLFRKLRDTWFGVDIIQRSKESIVHSDSSRVFRGLRVRDENNLPKIMKSKSIWDKLLKPKGSHFVETSSGVFYFFNEMTNGCILFLLVNRFGMQITRIQDYVRNTFPNLRLYWTVLAEKGRVQETLNSLNEMRMVTIDNKPIMPAHDEGIGTYVDRKTHPNDPSVVFNAKRIKIELSEHGDDKMRILRNFMSNFEGKKEITDDDANKFIDKSNMKLTGVLVGRRTQETIDLTKSLFGFVYNINDSSDVNDFYNFCDEKITDSEIKKKMLSLCSGLGIEISNIDYGK